MREMRILVAFDFSESSVEALRQARAMAGGDNTVALCHVIPFHYDAQPFFSQFHQAAMLDAPEGEARLRAALAERVELLGGVAGLELFVENGAAYAEICKRAETWGADRIVLGSHGRSGLVPGLLGSVAERVVRYAHCSVRVARASEGAGVVLAATDHSDPSWPAVTAAAAEARRRGARLVLCSVADWTIPQGSAAAGALFGGVSFLPTAELQNQVRDALETLLQSALARVGVEGEARVLVGSPASAIVATAEELGAELVVVGTHGRTGFARLALGSVAERVVRTAPCSVEVVRLSPLVPPSAASA